MARTARSRAQQAIYADSDGENSDYDATPQPLKKAKGKKRVSDVYNPSAESGSPGRVPFMTVNINDDEAEKRRRRKSVKFLQPGQVGEGAVPNLSPSQDDGGHTDISRAALQLKQKQQLMAVAEAPVVNVPLDVMSSNFEEWMKMATDNKINATNSWNFALIDYFHDMSLLRNNGDNSINFQKASCTLDGCVKIWTSRVDSVGTETGRLLGDLASGGKGDDDDDGGAQSDNPDSMEQKARRAGKVRAESTLAKSAAQLRSKKFDLEFSVDPLFRKTCADFDEGGAQGLLMNHLSLGVGVEDSMKIIFDASDSMGRSKDDDDEVPEGEPFDEVDLTQIRNEFLPDLDVIEDKAISYSLEGFSFSNDGFNFENSMFASSSLQDDDDDDGFDNDAMGMDIDHAAGGHDTGEQDFFVGDQAVGDDIGADYELGPEDNDTMGMDAEGGDAHAPQSGRVGGFEPFDPRRAPNERDLILAMTEPGANGSSLDYFDQTFLKNWAGPEHWKLRKVIRRPDTTLDSAMTKSRREKKEPFKIDFFTHSTKSQKEIAKELFAPIGKGGSITLPQHSKGKRSRKGKEKEVRNENTLPDDMHFSSRQLVTLFLKPKFALKMRGQRARLNDGEVDENFWAQAAADQAAGRNVNDDENQENGAIPFNTQFFHDEYDDGPGFDDMYDGPEDGFATSGGRQSNLEPGDRDLLAETQGQSRRVRPEMVNYAKRAKRVDVRKLKENIWKGLDIIVPDSLTEESESELNSGIHALPPTEPAEPRKFTSVIDNLQKTYPKEKMEEISTSFCFICLLHLANERGLKLEAESENYLPTSEMELDEQDDDVERVGDIWGVKVFRDPNAIPSA